MRKYYAVKKCRIAFVVKTRQRGIVIPIALIEDASKDKYVTALVSEYGFNAQTSLV